MRQQQPGRSDELLPADDPNQDPFGLLYTWWRGDPLSDLRGIPGLAIERLDRQAALDAGIELDADEVLSRIDQGHQLYVARIENEVVAWGWSASQHANIGELGISMTMPPANRYLWDFVTRPEWRGQGIYAHLIQDMLRDEQEVERFWIGHDYGNVASGRGILRAGFRLVGELYENETGYYLAPVDYPERTEIGAALLGVPAVDVE